jgi:hypothetical protein
MTRRHLPLLLALALAFTGPAQARAAAPVNQIVSVLRAAAAPAQERVQRARLSVALPAVALASEDHGAPAPLAARSAAPPPRGRLFLTNRALLR